MTPSTLGVQALCHLYLGFTAMLVRIACATYGSPRLQRELQPTVIAIARVDVPVPSAFTLREAIPG